VTCPVRSWHADATVSLRRRRILVVALAACALLAAIFVITHAATDSHAARMRTSHDELRATTSALVSAGSTFGPSIDPRDPASVSALRGHSLGLAATLVDGAVGYCSREGMVFGDASVDVQGVTSASPRPLPPDQRDALLDLCRSPGDGGALDLPHPHDVVSFVLRPVTRGVLVWALVRVPNASLAEDARWRAELGSLSVSTVALVLVTLSAVVALGGGVRHLEASLQRLRSDLRAPVEMPATAEFAGLTHGLADMASHLADAQEQAQELTRVLAHRERLAGLGRVVAGVAHEIRNPLTGIKLKLDVMAREPGVAPARRAETDACLEEVARLDRTVRSLLVVARARRGEGHAEDDASVRAVEARAPVDLFLLVEERVALLRARSPSASVSVHREGDGRTAVARDGLARIVDNLLANAVDAAGPDGHVEVVGAVAPREVRVEVADDGPGVADDAPLFEPFFTTKGEGTGLGLWMARSLVEGAGGELTYARRDDRTVFTLTVPREGGPV
jgi:signal transduction histidine kinase